MYSFMNLIELLGGLGLFLYGMHVMSDSIQRRAGDRFRQILSILTRNRFTGILTGLGVTSLLQSSSATTVLLVSLVNAGLMGLEQSISVVMGANIGTTLTGWIVSVLGFKFKITALALPAIAAGIPFFFSKHEKRREMAGILIGFGILFLGLYMMKESVPDLKNNPEALSFLQRFSEVKLLNILFFVFVGTLLTITVQSSSAAMAITLTMAYQGWITFPIAAAIVLGENIGTTITAYLASLGMNVHARRTARAHMLFNVIGVIWMIIVFLPFIHLVDLIIPGDPLDPHAIPLHLSMFHTLFNVGNTLLLVGFISVIAKIVRRWIPDPEEAERGQLTFISTRTAEDVESNLISVQSELGRMSRMVHDMSSRVLQALQEDRESIGKTREEISAFEKETDVIQNNINAFLTNCMTSKLSESQAHRIRSMYRMAHELENIGDGCKHVIRLLEKKLNKEWSFHESGVEDLAYYQGHVLKFLRYNCDYLTGGLEQFSLELAREMENELNSQRTKLRKVVRKTLSKGADVRGEMAFLDVVRHLEQIGDSCYNLSEEIVSVHTL